MVYIDLICAFTTQRLQTIKSLIRVEKPGRDLVTNQLLAFRIQKTEIPVALSIRSQSMQGQGYAAPQPYISAWTSCVPKEWT